MGTRLASLPAAGTAVTTLTLDGRTVSVRAGRTVLEACREHGVWIPTLCHLDGVSSVSSCRLCLVEVNDGSRPLPACSTVVVDGMTVVTASERLVQHRRGVLEMLLAGGGHVCAWCPASGRCELEALATALGVDHLDTREDRRAVPVDASRARFAFDPGRCVLCTRCVRVCAEVEGAGTLRVIGRGARIRLATDGGDRWGASPSCTECGRCVAACPTGALLEKATASQGLAASAARPAPAPGAMLPLAPGRGARRARLATLWLDGCAGCHMSLLDLDEGLLALAGRLELVYSPLCDASDLPPEVDVCLVEGAVGTEAQLELVRRARARARVLVALGDCATRGNVPAMRDAAGGAGAVLRRAWGGGALGRDPALPALLERVRPVHEVVPVDRFVPGCPPLTTSIGRALVELVGGGPAARPDPGA